MLKLGKILIDIYFFILKRLELPLVHLIEHVSKFPLVQNFISTVNKFY